MLKCWGLILWKQVLEKREINFSQYYSRHLITISRHLHDPTLQQILHHKSNPSAETKRKSWDHKLVHSGPDSKQLYRKSTAEVGRGVPNEFSLTQNPTLLPRHSQRSASILSTTVPDHPKGKSRRRMFLSWSHQNNPRTQFKNNGTHSYNFSRYGFQNHSKSVGL